MRDEDVLSAIDAAEAQAIGVNQTTIATDRADALARYLGKPYGGDMAAPPGRSSVTSRDVADVVEGVLANVIKPFVSGEEVVQFDPLGPDDEERAQQETDYVNFIALQRNNGFLVLNAAMKDALLMRSGYAKCYWTKRSDVMVERYDLMSEPELAMLLQDEEVEITNATAVAEGVYNVQARRKRPTEFVKVDPCPPEEILVSARHRTPGLQDADFVQHRTHKTLSELRQMGYKVDDDVQDDDNAETQEDYARDRSTTGSLYDDDTQDMARRVVLFKESWIRIDKDGDGIAELRRVCQVGKTLLSDEETDIIPLASFCPILMPHQHQGVSVYDMIEDLARTKTALLRNYLDNKYVVTNGRVFANAQVVNIDDLLLNRPGGVIRTDGPVDGNVLPLQIPDTGTSSLQGLEYLDTVRENRTGYTRQTQGLSNDALSTETLGGQMLQLSQSQLRLEMIARTLAETGVREMFTIIHALTLKHSTRAEKVRLRNKWVDINPREWVRRTDLSISVGIGSSSQQTLMAGLTMIGQAQEKAMALGLVMPDNVYNLCKKLTNAVGFKNVEEFFTAPPINPQTGKADPPPQQPPYQVQVEQMRQQGEQARAQMKTQSDAQMEEMRAMVKQKELELNAMLKKIEQEGALALQQSNDIRQSQLDEHKAGLDAQFREAEMESKERIADRNNLTALEIARIGVGVDDGTALAKAQAQAAGFDPLVASMSKVLEAVSGEKEIVRDPSGRATGVRPKKAESTLQ